jgi:hypothetical protein
MITKVFTQQNMARLAVVAGAAVVVLGAGAIKSDASIKQTANGDGSITVAWDDTTTTDFSIGIAHDIENQYDTGNRAKADAESRRIVLPADAREYTFTGIDNTKEYDVALCYTRGSESYSYSSYSTCSSCYGKLPPITNLTQEKWWKYALSVDVKWDALPGNCNYEVVFMDSKGKTIEKKTVTYNGYNHKIDNKKIYTVKVRGIRKAGYNSSLGEETTEWSAPEYLFVQPTVTGYSIDKKTGAMTIKWDKVKGVTSYKVYIATKSPRKLKSYKKVAAVKANKNTATVKGLGKKGKTKFDPKKKYYAIVLPYKKVNGKTVEKGAVYCSVLKDGKATEDWLYKVK